MVNKKIVIIGGGPTGLGAAYRLHELGYDNWVLYEKSDDVGGHSTSHVDPMGFVWDEGGHVIFSHYPYFDKLIDDMLGKEVHERVRESWVYLQDVCVPYPFQNNLRYLPKPLQVSCLMGAAEAAASRPPSSCKRQIPGVLSQQSKQPMHCAMRISAARRRRQASPFASLPPRARCAATPSRPAGVRWRASWCCRGSTPRRGSCRRAA